MNRDPGLTPPPDHAQPGPTPGDPDLEPALDPSIDPGAGPGVDPSTDPGVDPAPQDGTLVQPTVDEAQVGQNTLRARWHARRAQTHEKRGEKIQDGSYLNQVGRTALSDVEGKPHDHVTKSPGPISGSIGRVVEAMARRRRIAEGREEAARIFTGANWGIGKDPKGELRDPHVRADVKFKKVVAEEAHASRKAKIEAAFAEGRIDADKRDKELEKNDDRHQGALDKLSQTQEPSKAVRRSMRDTARRTRTVKAAAKVIGGEDPSSAVSKRQGKTAKHKDKAADARAKGQTKAEEKLARQEERQAEASERLTDLTVARTEIQQRLHEGLRPTLIAGELAVRSLISRSRQARIDHLRQAVEAGRAPAPRMADEPQEPATPPETKDYSVDVGALSLLPGDYIRPGTTEDMPDLPDNEALAGADHETILDALWDYREEVNYVLDSRGYTIKVGDQLVVPEKFGSADGKGGILQVTEAKQSYHKLADGQEYYDSDAFVQGDTYLMAEVAFTGPSGSRRYEWIRLEELQALNVIENGQFAARSPDRLTVMSEVVDDLRDTDPATRKDRLLTMLRSMYNTTDDDKALENWQNEALKPEEVQSFIQALGYNIYESLSLEQFEADWEGVDFDRPARRNKIFNEEFNSMLAALMGEDDINDVDKNFRRKFIEAYREAITPPARPARRTNGGNGGGRRAPART